VSEVPEEAMKVIIQHDDGCPQSESGKKRLADAQVEFEKKIADLDKNSSSFSGDVDTLCRNFNNLQAEQFCNCGLEKASIFVGQNIK
jgi:hypothetical protein